MRKRMVLLASLHGEIKLAESTCTQPITVRQAISDLPALKAGETSSGDKLHVTSTLSEKICNVLKLQNPVERGVTGLNI